MKNKEILNGEFDTSECICTNQIEFENCSHGCCEEPEPGNETGFITTDEYFAAKKAEKKTDVEFLSEYLDLLEERTENVRKIGGVTWLTFFMLKADLKCNQWEIYCIQETEKGKKIIKDLKDRCKSFSEMLEIELKKTTFEGIRNQIKEEGGILCYAFGNKVRNVFCYSVEGSNIMVTHNFETGEVKIFDERKV
ncbi:MAG: hypothetical protein Unbinned5350contig1001_19 [Prokaryotic dsDNA virus sp.]|nr:MAG: hypothetical protein Unbinned5350contig1001_19 [Prokaryotic dsDNA virus sp.]|tara:strand:- start:24643 stop:25224 length:582 start_codon:yes stop_codon:yes gene_type:complete